jgi:hypothetical protein
MLVEPLVINSELITIFSFAIILFRFAKCLNNITAASFPISNAGWVMVVKDGFNKSAVLKFENEITFKSFGILILSALQTC